MSKRKSDFLSILSALYGFYCHFSKCVREGFFNYFILDPERKLQCVSGTTLHTHITLKIGIQIYLHFTDFTVNPRLIFTTRIYPDTLLETEPLKIGVVSPVSQFP